MTNAFAAFRFESYRFQWSADLLTSWAFEMETLILAWYVLVATDSVFLLAAFGALQFGGTLLSPYFGTLADRFSRRRMLITLRSLYGLAATTLATLALSERLETWHVFVIAILAGLVRPSDLVVRNALIADTVPESQLTNAMGLSRTTMDSARIMGALAGAGLFSALGLGVSYLVVTAFYIGSIALTCGVARGAGRVVSGAWRELRLGLRYIRRKPEIGAMLWLAFLVNLTAFPLSHGLLPYVARDIYQIDANGLAHLMAAYAIGAMIGSLGLAWSGRTSTSTRLISPLDETWYSVLITRL